MNLLNSLTQHLAVYAVQMKNNFVREAVYRTNFLTTLVVDIIWITVEFSLFAVIYKNTTELAGWTQPQAYFFLGVFFASDAIYTTLFQRNFWEFSDLVNKGELDILLTKPVSSLFLSTTRYMSLTNVFNILLGLAILIRYAEPAGFPGGWHWLWVGFWLFIGAYTALVLRFFFSIWIFWTERGFALSRLYYQFFHLASKPDSLFPQIARITLKTILPFAFIGSVPARALLHGLDWSEWIQVIAVLTLFTGFDFYLWNRGLRRYQSASS